jgi:cysteine desulfurase
MIYFDHNATTPLMPQAQQAWIDAAERYVGNPSSLHRPGARSEAALQEARRKIAVTLGCDALDIIWTSGATESSNAALHHFSETLGSRKEAWLSAAEHPCTMEAARRWFPGRLRLIPVGKGGTVRLDWMKTKLRGKTPGLVAIMAANNETGVLQPWQQALAICRESNVPFFCDAAQWIGKLPAHGLGQCDLVSGAAHKFGGPKGVGFLKCPSKGRFHPLIRGGPQQEGRRAGTENVAGVLSMVAALQAREAAFGHEEAQSLMEGGAAVLPKAVELRMTWRDDFEQQLLRAVPGARIIGSGQRRLWNTVCVLMPRTDCRQRWVVKLDKLGLAVSTGSACSSGREKPSHVLKAMGFPAADSARVLRFSSGWETSQEQWRELLDGLRTVFLEMQRESNASDADLKSRQSAPKARE